MGMSSRNKTARRPDVELHIEELTFVGLDSYNRFHLGDAVKQEIARLLADEGGVEPVRHHAYIDRVDGGAFSVAPASKERDVGAQVARSVVNSLRTKP